MWGGSPPGAGLLDEDKAVCAELHTLHEQERERGSSHGTQLYLSGGSTALGSW